MKKIIFYISMAMLVMYGSMCGSVHAESDFSVSEKIQSSFLLNNETALYDKLNELNDIDINETIEMNIESYKRSYKTDKIESMIDGVKEMLNFAPKNSFCFYMPITDKYSKQYADLSCFDDLLSKDKAWIVAVDSIHLSLCYYEKDFSKCEIDDQICDDEAVRFLKDTKAIEDMVNGEIDEKIVDCKIVYYDNIGLLLYLKGENTDYGIILYDYKISSFGELVYDGYLEKFKIYTMTDIMNSYGMISFCKAVGYYRNYYVDLLEQKPVYESEITSLMEDGLIAGTDKGAEPLKPLSRIEATAMLVRILGLENEPTEQTSYFADIASDNWGAKYANIASDHGIAAGVGDNNFAPNELITSSQFASLLLRSQNVPNDWQTAINVLVEQGMVKQEQADKMDLFTRGDMAKIIYECKEKGMI